MILTPSPSVRSRTLQLFRRYRTPLIATVVIVVLALFISQKHGEAAQIASSLQHANPLWIALALMTNLVVIAVAGLSYRVVLGTLGLRHPWAWLANLHLKRHLVGTVTPIGGPASIYVFVRSLGTRGVDASDALFAAAIRSVAGYSAFMLMLVPVLILSRPSALIMAGAGALLLVLLLMISTMLFLLQQDCNPAWLLDRLHPRFSSLIHNARSHALRPRDFALPFTLAVVHNMLGVLTLYLSLLAVGYDGALTTAVVGYAIGNLFTMIAPVFQGIGVVELTMAVALQQLGVPIPMAVAATLLFRFADLWFPFLLGVSTHAPQVQQVRRVARRIPAVVVGAVGLLILLTPLAPAPLPVALYVPDLLMPMLAVLGAAWCILLAYALWFRKPVAQITAYGALVTVLPLLVFQAEGLML